MQRLRRSFRRKKGFHCINCGHTKKECFHKEYENEDLMTKVRGKPIKDISSHLLDPSDGYLVRFEIQFTFFFKF